MLDLFVKLTFW